MIILHVSDVKSIEANGVASVVPQYIISQSKYEKVALYDLNNKYKNDDIDIFYYEKYHEISELPQSFCKPDIVIFHEIYKPKYIKLYKECIKKGIPYIIVPHGCLTKYAQKSKKLKKIVGNILFFNKFMKKTQMIQYLSENELKNTAFPKLKYFVLGNGIDRIPNSNQYLLNDKSNKFKFVYVGRYDYFIKGIDQLLKACYIIKDEMIKNNIVIEFYGIGNKKNMCLINNDIKKYDLQKCVKVNGPIYNTKKRNTISKNQVYIQASRTEGQPLSVMEAMALGMPLLLTVGTGFEKIINEINCGIITECDYIAISESIIKIFYMKDNLIEMSKKSYDYAVKNFNWDFVSNEAIKIYKKVIK